MLVTGLQQCWQGKTGGFGGSSINDSAPYGQLQPALDGYIHF